MSDKSNFERADLDENPKTKIPMQTDEKQENYKPCQMNYLQTVTYFHHIKKALLQFHSYLIYTQQLP